MYSKAFFNEFNRDFAESFKNGLISVQLPIKDFFDNNFKTIIAQIILIWLLAALLKQTQQAEIEGLLLNKIAENYRYASILCSLILTMPLLEKVPTTSDNNRIFVHSYVFLVNTFIIAISLARILSTLGAFESTGEGISQIMSLGITFNEIRLTIGILIFAILSAYVTLSVSWLIQSLTVIFGALGIGIGFGLQNIVNNFASGIILLFERSIKVGDIVVVGGEWGTVKKLGLRATVIQTFDNSEMIVPNSNLVSSTVNNWTLSERKTRFVASVGVDHDSDIQLVTKLLLEAASNHPKVMQDPAPSVVFTAFGDSSLNFDLRGWVPDIDFRASTKNEIMYEINRLFRENNIVIPFPQRDIHIKEPLKMPETTKKN